MLIPVDADVESTVALLSVVDRPVETEAIPVEAEVERTVALLFVVESPVESDVTPL